MAVHPELSGGITTLTIRNTFCAANDTLIDQDDGRVTKGIFAIL